MKRNTGRLVVVIALALVVCSVVLAAEQRMVSVAVYDDTESRRIPAKAEMWLRGHGSAWLHKACDKLRNGSLSCGAIDLGMREVAQPLELIIYPDGRAGREIKAGFKMSSGMCKPGCDRDRILLSISDSGVDIKGNPIRAQHGKFTLTFKRR